MSSLVTPVLLATLATTGQPHCLLETSRNGDILTLTAIVVAPQDISGHYSLAITKKSSSGQARSLSSGRFVLKGKPRKTLSIQTHSLSPDGKIEASLTLDIAGKNLANHLSCRKTITGDGKKI